MPFSYPFDVRAGPDPDDPPGRAIKAGARGAPLIAVALHFSPHFDDLRQGHRWKIAVNRIISEN